MAEQFFMTIDNENAAAESGETLDCYAPYEQANWATIPAASAADVDRAVRSADTAFRESWWAFDARRRAAALSRLADAMDAHAERIAPIEMRDCGKPIREAKMVASVSSQFFRYGAALCLTTEFGQIQQGMVPGLHCQMIRQPFGVVAVQVPWNNPIGVLVQEAVCALAAGNTIVVKPSEFGSCSVLAMGDVIREADIPPGVINIVSGLGPVTGAALCDHPLVRKIVFTGGGEAAQIVATNAARRFVPLVLELGGKSASLVFEDANIDNAVRSLSNGFTGSTGQSCTAASRILVQRPIYDAFVEKFLAAVSAFTLGDPSDPTTDIGPLTYPQHADRVAAKVQMGIDEGAKLLHGGGRPDDPELADHPLFFSPTVFGDVDPAMRIAQEEVFGPVTCLIPFDDEKQAVEIANGTDFGLGASVWTKDINRVQRMIRDLYSGTVWVNTYRVGDPSFPYGGVKESGYGRECGLAGFEEMTYLKSVRLSYEGL